jgi:pyruvate/2-oxoglutarate dehydrogenase complex dihydrolipoamide dehydrogenase (E3) component
MRRKDAIVEEGRAVYERAVADDPGIELHRHAARFLSPTRIGWDGGEIEADRTIIAVGSVPAWPTVPGLRESGAVDSAGLLDLKELPRRLVVVGGGAIGCEFAQVFARFGSDVTLVLRSTHVLRTVDRDATELLEEAFERDGVRIVREARVAHVTREQGMARVRLVHAGGEEEVLGADALLVAVGRRAPLDPLCLEAAGIETHMGGIGVDAELRTAQPNIWAVGDALNRRLYTHVATYEGPIAARNALAGAGERPDYTRIPDAVFTDPEIASIGLTREDAADAGHDVVDGTYPLAKIGKARAIGATEGFARILVDRETRKILGATIVGHHAADLMPEMLTAMAADGTIAPIRRAIHIHPTMSEGVNAAARLIETTFREDPARTAGAGRAW